MNSGFFKKIPASRCFAYTSAHVIFSRGSRLESLSQQVTFVSRKAVALRSSAACRTRPRCCFLSHMSTTSLSTCTPVRPSIRPSTRPSLLSASHGDLPCAIPSNVYSGPLAETHPPTLQAPTSASTNTTHHHNFFSDPPLSSLLFVET